MNRKKEKKISYIVLIIFAILFVLPLCWVILASLDSNANIAAKIPELTLNNYKEILTSGTTWYSLKNGLILSLGTAVLTVVLAGLIAYPLSRYEMRYKRIFMLGMLFMTSLPITTVMVPVYKLFVMVKYCRCDIVYDSSKPSLCDMDDEKFYGFCANCAGRSSMD